MNRRILRWAAALVAVVAALGLAVWTTRDGEQWPDPLDPGNPGPEGARAVAQVLRDQGVNLRVARSAEALDSQTVDEDTTVVVTGASALSPTTVDRLRRHAAPGLVVLVDPPSRVLREYGDGLAAVPAGTELLPTTCRGPALFDGLELDVDRATAFSGATGATCFEAGDHALLAETDAAGSTGRTILFGAGSALTNEAVTRGDNAAVALRLLGQRERLVWYVPDPADAATDETVTLTSLLPDWVVPGLVLAGLTTLALLLWRVRRLGPLAREPLPVVVRGVETAHSRGRLYRRSADRGHAARALRRAARADLGTRLRLERAATPAGTAAAAARHLGAPVTEIERLLDDDQPPPHDDHELVRLAQDLGQLRREVRQG